MSDNMKLVTWRNLVGHTQPTAQVNGTLVELDDLAHRLKQRQDADSQVAAEFIEMIFNAQQPSAELVEARRTAEYWKAEHIAGNAKIDELVDKNLAWLNGWNEQQNQIEHLTQQHDELAAALAEANAEVERLHRQVEDTITLNEPEYKQLNEGLAALKAQSQEPVGDVTIDYFRGDPGMVNYSFDYYGDLPEGTHKLFTAPPPSAQVQEPCEYMFNVQVEGKANAVFDTADEATRFAMHHVYLAPDQFQVVVDTLNQGQMHSHSYGFSAVHIVPVAKRRATPQPSAEDAARIFELYEQALKASWPEGAMGDAFDYWNQARIARGEGK